MRLLFATHNDHKTQEIRDIFISEGLDIELISLKDLKDYEEIEEDGETLEANALLKTHEAYRRHQMNCFSDDTGLEVDALEGRPGVHSARYSGPECRAEDNITKLLSELSGQSNRQARFRTVIALLLDGKQYLFEGIVEGAILKERRGKHGFGYDPIFIPKGSDKSFAEMSEVEKNSVSHRGRAIRALTQFLKSLE